MPDPLAGSSILDLETALALLAVLVQYWCSGCCGFIERTFADFGRLDPSLAARAETMQPASATNGCL